MAARAARTDRAILYAHGPDHVPSPRGGIVLSRVVKSIAFLDHLPGKSEEACDRHYVQHHVPFVVNMMRETGIDASYYTAKAVARRHIDGHWTPAVREWRSASIRVSIPAEGGALEEGVRRAIEDDHRRFLCNLRSYLCSESVVRGRATEARAKFILEVASRPGSFAASRQPTDEFLDAVTRRVEQSDDIALTLVNRVRRQEVAQELDLPGQGFSPGVFTDEPDAAAFVEIYASSEAHGRAFIEGIAGLMTALECDAAVREVRCTSFVESSQIARGELPDYGVDR